MPVIGCARCCKSKECEQDKNYNKILPKGWTREVIPVKGEHPIIYANCPTCSRKKRQEERDADIQELITTISKHCYKAPKGYDTHYSPFHLLLAKYLYKRGYRRIKSDKAKRNGVRGFGAERTERE